MECSSTIDYISKATVIPVVGGARGTITKALEKRLDELEVRMMNREGSMLTGGTVVQYGKALALLN